MKRCWVGVVAAALVIVLLSFAAPVAAHDYDRDDSDYLPRYVAYLIHPIGLGLEYGITRPIHWVVSRPYARIIFGHAPRNEIDEAGNYPVEPIARPAPPVIEGPVTHKPLLKPRDQYWDREMFR